MYDSNLSCKFGKVYSLFYSRVTTAYYVYFQILKKVCITGSTERYTLSYVVCFIFTTYRSWMSTWCYDNCTSFIYISIDIGKLLNLSFKLYRYYIGTCSFTTEFSCLCSHPCNQTWSWLICINNLSRIVFYLVCNRNLTAVLWFLYYQSTEFVSACI